MSNWMAGIHQAGSGLEAARYGMSVVSQNMANATNPGYTRQTADLTAVDMSPVSGISTGHGTFGGVGISGTSRNTDLVLDARVRSEGAKGALADTTASQLSAIEGVLGEPSESGLATQLDSYWNAWGRVASDPSSTASRTVLLRSATSVTATLNAMADSLSDLASTTSASLSSDVASVNNAASRLAELNGQIAVGTATGANVNSLLDARDGLLTTLSSLSGASVTIEANGGASVSLGGQSLVNGSTTTALTVDSSFALSVGGAAVGVAGGSIAARIGSLTGTLPAYRNTLDAVANSLASTVNTAQAGGYDRNGVGGTAMFAGTGAGNLQVAITDPNLVAAAGVPGGGLDNTVASALSQAALLPGSANAIFTALVGNVASTSAAASQRADTQSAVVGYVGNLKSAMSGVSFDEEATTMLAMQHAFNASSRVLTAIDSMLDTLINHTGVVGRA